MHLVMCRGPFGLDEVSVKLTRCKLSAKGGNWARLQWFRLRFQDSAIDGENTSSVSVEGDLVQKRHCETQYLPEFIAIIRVAQNTPHCVLGKSVGVKLKPAPTTPIERVDNRLLTEFKIYISSLPLEEIFSR